jgi:FkbM family methyltransferase
MVADVANDGAFHKMNHYSQNNEQEIILELFKGKTYGCFLDIGAYDAKLLSNTRALYELGWSGVMVEPSPEPFVALLKEYGNDPRVTLIHAAVGLTDGLKRMYATADAISTTDEEFRATWEASGHKFTGSFWCPRVTPMDIQNTLGGLLFDFVNIDTEGNSGHLLMECLRLNLGPEVYCVEHDHKHEKLTRLAEPHGYRWVATTGENLILAKA